jgi:acetylornithine/succinyldiaminopimelate/putrescine aminotransferase
MTSDEFVAKCKDNGILIFSFGPTTVRFVTRFGIVKADMEELLGRLERMLR